MSPASVSRRGPWSPRPGIFLISFAAAAAWPRRHAAAFALQMSCVFHHYVVILRFLRFARGSDVCKRKRKSLGNQVFPRLCWPGQLKSIFLNREKGRPQGGPPTASPAQRVVVGKEEQGSGRMTSFFAMGIKRRGRKADFETMWKGRSRSTFSRNQTKPPRSGGPKPKPSDSGSGLEARSSRMSAR